MTETWNTQSWKDLESKISQLVSTTESASRGNAKKLMVDLYDFGEYIKNTFATTNSTAIFSTVQIEESKLFEECLKNWYQICEKNQLLEQTNNMQRVKIDQQKTTIDKAISDLKVVRNDYSNLQEKYQQLLDGMGGFEQLTELSENLVQVSQEFIHGSLHEELATIKNQITLNNQALVATYSLSMNQVREDIKDIKRGMSNNSSISTAGDPSNKKRRTAN